MYCIHHELNTISFHYYLSLYGLKALLIFSLHLRSLSMATNQHILGLATNSSFQIPSICIKLETTNYYMWLTTTISSLETFDLGSFILNPKPPSKLLSLKMKR